LTFNQNIGELSNFQKVKVFHEVFGVLTNDKPTVISPEDILLRWKLIKEEYGELWKELFDMQGIKKNIDLHEVAKEMADLLYVIYGTAVAFGIDIDACFDEVHKSNMSKLTKDGEVLRRSDGKVLKSKEYKPADLRKIINV
jgi:predicted HAD superfamily Cof-like phosphohydrolase